MYVLIMNNGQLYFGFSKNLRNRMKEHKEGRVFTTKKFLPIHLIYYESYLSAKDAIKREKMLKRYGSTYAHLKARISESVKDSQGRG